MLLRRRDHVSPGNVHPDAPAGHLWLPGGAARCGHREHWHSLPGETMLLVAAIAAGTTHQLSIAGGIVAAASGAILGDNLGFWVGREGGYPLLRRYRPYIHVEERPLKLGQYLFLKHGGKGVFFRRFR